MFVHRIKSGKNSFKNLLRIAVPHGKAKRFYTVLNLSGFSDDRLVQLKEALRRKRIHRGDALESQLDEQVVSIVLAGLQESMSSSRERVRLNAAKSIIDAEWQVRCALNPRGRYA